MKQTVFLGGTCGTTTWRRDVAIPALDAAGVAYFNPQVGTGEWTPAAEAEELRAKTGADVLLFVINGDTRGIASLVEAAYFLGAGRPLALVIEDVPEGAALEGNAVPDDEREDLNRGRLFLRTLAEQHRVPVFTDIAKAVQHAIQHARGTTASHT